MNIQPIEKREKRTDGLLSVHSIFPTIQGEGPFCGVPCVFVRLAGCNLMCPACDTDYTSARELTSPLLIFDSINELRPNGGLVVITGGEPFRQDLSKLLMLLVRYGYYVQIETNGTLEPETWSDFALDVTRRKGVYIVCSPKTPKICRTAQTLACAFKYVVRAGMVAADGLPQSALDMINPPARPPHGWNRPIYVQPLDSKDAVENAAHTNEAVASCMRHGYTLQIQVHKVIGVE